MQYNRISKGQIKVLHSLKQKKFRQKYNKYTIEGQKIVKELILSKPNMIELLVATEDWLINNHDILVGFLGKILLCSTKNMEMMSQFKTASPVLILCNFEENNEGFDDLANLNGRFLFLEEIQDPGNLGTIFRTADWFGVDGIFLSENSVEAFNHKVIQSSMGSVFRIPHKYLNSNDFSSIRLPKIATTLNGKPLADYVFPPSFVICFGNEGAGLKKETILECKDNLLIDDSKSLGAESLNIAISCAVVLYASQL